MRTVDTETQTALFGAKDNGLALRHYVWFDLLDGSDYGFHSDIDPALLQEVVDGETNLSAWHTYYGDGAIQRLAGISLTTGLTVRRATIELSNIHSQVNEMVRGHNVRNARVQIHVGLIDAGTGQLVARPRIHFLGKVNTINPKRGIIGGSGGVTVDCTSFVDELTRTNPAKSSDAHQRTRISDRFYRYVDIMGEVRVKWGGKQ